MKNSKERLVSRPFGGLVNLPDRGHTSSKEVDMSKIFLVIMVIAIALLAFAPSAQNMQLNGGNGGLVNLPGGGGRSAAPEFEATSYAPFELDQRLNSAEFYPTSFAVGGGRALIAGFYRGYVVLAAFDGTHLTFQGTYLFAISPGGTQLITRWVCRCCNDEQEVCTSVGGSNINFYNEQHDKAVEARKKYHPKKIQ